MRRTRQVSIRGQPVTGSSGRRRRGTNQRCHIIMVGVCLDTRASFHKHTVCRSIERATETRPVRFSWWSLA